jgi:16S rRNA (guanine966-N2)-methyltransferase
MRIIAGTHRGRKILSPEDDSTTRPIPDRVKQALFDRLASQGRIEDAVVLDVFSGTGSMGLECLSRGAQHVTFIEKDRSALDLLKKNLDTLKFEADSRVMKVDALSAASIDMLPRPRNEYTLAFFDPPYAMMEDETKSPRLYQQLEHLAARMAPGAMLVLRLQRDIPAPPIPNWGEPESHPYGSMILHFYRRAA